MSNSQKSSIHSSNHSPDIQFKNITNFYSQKEGGEKSERPSQVHESKNHKIKVLKPIINYQHNANKILGDMTQEDYFFFKPVLGMRKLSNNKANEHGKSQQKESTTQNTKKEVNSTQAKDLSGMTYPFNHSLNQNHLCSPKQVGSQLSYLSQKGQTHNRSVENENDKVGGYYNGVPQFGNKNLKFIGDGSKKENYSSPAQNKNLSSKIDSQTDKKSLIINGLHGSGQKFDEDIPTFNHERLSTGRIKVIIGKKDSQADTHLSGPSKKMSAYQQNKMFQNNPLKDISNQLDNLSNKPEKALQEKKQSLPFEIAPKQLKINNFFDAQQQNGKDLAENNSNINNNNEINNFQQRAIMTARIPDLNSLQKQIQETSQQLASNTQNSGLQQKLEQYEFVPNKPHFEKRRVSDQALRQEEKQKVVDTFLQVEPTTVKIKEKSAKVSINNSILTSSTATSPQTTTNAQTKKVTAVYYSNNNNNNSNATFITNNTNNTTSQLQNRKSLGYKQAIQTIQQQNGQWIIQELINQEKFLGNFVETLKRRGTLEYSLSDIEKGIKDLNRSFKSITSDTSLLSLVRQHTRTHYISFIFIKLFEEDLSGFSKNAEGLQQIIVNALDYIKKNFKAFLEILAKQNSQQKKMPKKELNANPFGVAGITSRNNANKENFGGPSNNTVNGTCTNSKSENKMAIKQNNQIALAFLKKICRLSRTNGERFKELINILNQIESGVQVTKIKEQIKRLFNQIKGEKSIAGHIMHHGEQTQRQSTQGASKRHKRRETLTLDLDDEPSPPILPSEMISTKIEKKENQHDKVMPFALALDKENSPPNMNEPQGRLSLQPQPLKSLNSPPQISIQQPQISFIAKRPGQRISNTHEAIAVNSMTNQNAPPQLQNQKLQMNEENGVQYCIVPPTFNYVPNKSNSLTSRPLLPSEISKGHEYTLVLDLDETLIHFDPKIKTYRPRPGVLQFLCEMSKYYEVAVFTAALKDYADWIINDLDKQGFISHRLYRDHTRLKNGVYIKDLSRLGRDMQKTIIIDNIEDNFQCQQENGIPILAWYNDPTDRELEKYTPFLKGLVTRRVKDVRHDIYHYKQHLLKESQQKITSVKVSHRHSQHQQVQLKENKENNNGLQNCQVNNNHHHNK